MEFHTVGEPDTIMWVDESGSGIARPGDAIWKKYQAFLKKGGEPERPLRPQIDMAAAMAMVADEVAHVSAQVRSGNTQAEFDSWPQQDAEAKAWLANPDTPTPLLDAMMLPWEDKREFCELQLQLHATYATALGELIAWRRIAEAAIEVYFAHGPRERVTIRYPDVPTAS